MGSRVRLFNDRLNIFTRKSFLGACFSTQTGLIRAFTHRIFKLTIAKVQSGRRTGHHAVHLRSDIEFLVLSGLRGLQRLEGLLIHVLDD